MLLRLCKGQFGGGGDCDSTAVGREVLMAG